MAEAEKKDTKSSRRYGKPPKIGAKRAGDEDKSGHDAEASKKAEKTAGDEKGDIESKDDPGPEASVDAGTDGIEVNARHETERKEMAGRHAHEMVQMHTRHQKEHSTMAKRHAAEMAQKSEGEGGTEPE